MQGLKKRCFIRAHKYLERIRSNRRDLISLYHLQMFILSRISACEKRSKVLRLRIKALEKLGIKEGSKYIALCMGVEEWRQAGYIWRCFGDAIAFIYMDNFSLKHVHYHVDNNKPKQSSGFIGGKKGSINEILVLRRLIKNGVPTLLTDITNTIRHGDICLMNSPDPKLIEIKNSANLNRRGKKQRDSIQKISSFFRTDEAQNMRGFDKILRRAAHEGAVYFPDTMQNSIEAAIKNKYSIISPELGIYYITSSADIAQALKFLDDYNIMQPMLFSLNEQKVNRTWAPYMPFTLSFSSRKILWDFIVGRVVCLVLLDFGQINKITEPMGYRAEIDLGDENFPVTLKRISDTQQVKCSWHMLRRVALDMLSLEWIIKAAINSLETNADDAPQIM